MTPRTYLIPNHDTCEAGALHQWRCAAFAEFRGEGFPRRPANAGSALPSPCGKVRE
jgi:hypothetical protein